MGNVSWISATIIFISETIALIGLAKKPKKGARIMEQLGFLLQPVINLLFSLAFAFIYIGASLWLETKEYGIAGPLINTFLLFFTVWGKNMFFTYVVTKMSSYKIIDKGEEHLSLIIAYLYIALTSGILSAASNNSYYLMILIIAVSTIIGTYIPTDIVNREQFNQSWEKLKESIKKYKKSIFIYSVILIVFFILQFSEEETVLKQALSGAGIGSILFIIIAIIYIQAAYRQSK